MLDKEVYKIGVQTKSLLLVNYGFSLKQVLETFYFLLLSHSYGTASYSLAVRYQAS